MAFLNNTYGELWVIYHVQAKCCMCGALGDTGNFKSLEDAVAHLEMNSICMECMFDGEKKDKPSSKGKKKRG